MKCRGLLNQIIITVIICLSYIINGIGQSSKTPDFKLFLVGDAGDGDTTGKTLLDLKTQLLNNPKSAVVFLGDNCYINSFLIPVQIGGYDGSKKAKRRIMSQLNILKDYKGFVYFIPGNHDWWNDINFKKGKKRLLMEQGFIGDTLKSFITLQNHEQETFLPNDGNPGPVSKLLNDGKIRIIFIDTYRLIIEEGRKKNKDSFLLNTFYNELNAQLTDASNNHEKIIVVAHHPIQSRGKHSQPISFIEKLNKHFKDSNTNYPPYHRMAVHIQSVLKEHNQANIFYISGHEHSLEYLNIDSINYIVSGAGSKIDKVKLNSIENENEYIQFNEEGFFEIDFYPQKESALIYHRKNNNTAFQVHCLSGCN